MKGEMNWKGVNEKEEREKGKGIVKKKKEHKNGSTKPNNIWKGKR